MNPILKALLKFCTTKNLLKFFENCGVPHGLLLTSGGLFSGHLLWTVIYSFL